MRSKFRHAPARPEGNLSASPDAEIIGSRPRGKWLRDPDEATSRSHLGFACSSSKAARGVDPIALLRRLSY